MKQFFLSISDPNPWIGGEFITLSTNVVPNWKLVGAFSNHVYHLLIKY